MNEEDDIEIGEAEDRDDWEKQLHEESLHSNDNAAEDARRGTRTKF